MDGFQHVGGQADRTLQPDLQPGMALRDGRQHIGQIALDMAGREQKYRHHPDISHPLRVQAGGRGIEAGGGEFEEAVGDTVFRMARPQGGDHGLELRDPGWLAGAVAAQENGGNTRVRSRQSIVERHAGHAQAPCTRGATAVAIDADPIRRLPPAGLSPAASGTSRPGARAHSRCRPVSWLAGRRRTPPSHLMRGNGPMESARRLQLREQPRQGPPQRPLTRSRFSPCGHRHLGCF